jgi:hypothetical protein
MRLPTISLRALFLLGFAVGMPLLALPPVTRRIETWLYGPPPVDLLRPAAARPLSEVIAPQAIERVSPASFEELAPLDDIRSRLPHEGIDALAAEPPPLAPPAAFPPLSREPLALDKPAAAAAQPELNAAAIARLKEIRQELENLGAEYILLETTDGSGTYRFHCQMKIDSQSPYTRQFEAAAANPLAAAEEVLSAARAWRSAARPADGTKK